MEKVMLGCSSARCLYRQQGNRKLSAQIIIKILLEVVFRCSDKRKFHSKIRTH
jgi:hypothetical protein